MDPPPPIHHLSQQLLRIKGMRGRTRTSKINITVEEYKNVMRAVVRECYKKKILDGDKVKEKVKEYVRAVKSGEQLEVGHHSSKRAETSGEKSAVPVKRQKVDD
ncbi:hypothetical protein Aduo_010883 [Ancylostoma duodenale]